jgi:FAD/FMN-containing dehydrogenase
MAPGLPPSPAIGLDILKAAGLEARLLHREDPEYQARQASFWSATARIAQPSLIVQPRSASEVAQAVKALASAGQQFAIRSGGHTQYSGANNIHNGVTIDLGLMTWTRYKPESETVDVGPGGRWRDVYAELRPHKRVVAGGREGGVGVAGLLLGGGNTFFTARLGFACDNVVAYEVVLADGSIVTADSTQNQDLFLALKGGSSNFGIVTNFTLKAIENDEVWGGLAVFPKQVSAQAAEALVRFNDNIIHDVDSNLLTFYTYMGKGNLSTGYCISIAKLL